MMSGIIVLIVLILLSAFFSASETALTSVPRLRLAQLAEEKKIGAQALNKLRREPGRMLTIILIGNNVVNIGASVLAASLVFEYFKNFSHEETSLAVGLITLVMTILILVFGEITPKTIALRNSEEFALIASPVILGMEFILSPVATLLNWMTHPLISMFGATPEGAVTEREIEMVLSAGEKAGIIEKEEKEMISSIFEFGETQASEVMTPRPDISAIEVNQSIDNLRLLIKQVGRSRIPVYEGNLDNIVGVVYSKDLIAKDGAEIKDFMRQVIIVPETKKIDELMRQMQSARTHIAIVVDEYGITSGLVTMEDLLEEIVGEIHDEFEKSSKRIDKIGDQSWLIDATISIDDLKSEIGIKLPEGEYDTLAGFVLAELGKVPAVGDRIKFDGVSIVVDKIYRRRVTRVRLEKVLSAGDELVGG